MSPSCKVKVQIAYQNEFLNEEDVQVLEQAAWEDGGIDIARVESQKETCRYDS